MKAAKVACYVNEFLWEVRSRFLCIDLCIAALYLHKRTAKGGTRWQNFEKYHFFAEGYKKIDTTRMYVW